MNLAKKVPNKLTWSAFGFFFKQIYIFLAFLILEQFYFSNIKKTKNIS